MRSISQVEKSPQGSLNPAPASTQDPKSGHLSESLVQMLLDASSVPWSLPWGVCSTAQPPSQWRTFSWYSAWLSPVTAYAIPLSPIAGPQRGEIQHLPLCSSTWGSHRLQWSLPSHIFHFRSFTIIVALLWTLPNSFNSNHHSKLLALCMSFCMYWL